MAEDKFELPEADANTIFGKPAEPRPRPVVPVRDVLTQSGAKLRSFNDHLQTKPTTTAEPNPFTVLQEANKAHEQLVVRLETLAEKLAGNVPPFSIGPENPPTAPGLLPLAARVAQLIQERSRHGVSLIDKIEEHLG